MGVEFEIDTPSRWLAEQARTSSLFGKMPMEVIPYGLDTETFRPRDRKAAREKFGIDTALRVALFVAEWAAEKRKGLELFLEAVRRMNKSAEFCLVAIGRGLPATGWCAQRLDRVRARRDDDVHGV